MNITSLERKMTKKEKAKEKRLKDKYDDSDMKKSMKKQYGDDWKNVYYATIRKKAMGENILNKRFSSIMQNAMDRLQEGEAGDHDRMYKVVHVKKGMMDIKAKTSYEAAKKFAKEKGLKSTAGVDTHLYPLEEGKMSPKEELKMLKANVKNPGQSDKAKEKMKARIKELEAMLEEGYKVLPNIDKERYTELPGLEGPFQTMSGKPIYYDPKEGAYYDRDTDMYLTYDEFKALDETDELNIGAKGDRPYKAPRQPKRGDPINPKHKGVDPKVLNMFLTNGATEGIEIVPTKPFSNPKADMKSGMPDPIRKPKQKKYTIMASVNEDAPISQMSRAELLDYLNMSEKDAEGISTKELMDMAQDVTMDQMEGHSPHKKGTEKYKKHMAAMHANSVDLNSMRNALKLDESVDTNTVVAQYTRATLDQRHNTWKKVCEQIDFIRSLVKEDVDIANVRMQIKKMHKQENIDHKITIKEDIDKLRDIVNKKSAMSIKFADGSMKVDMTTASIFLQVFDKVKEETQAKIVDRIQTKQGFLSVLDKMYSMIG